MRKNFQTSEKKFKRQEELLNNFVESGTVLVISLFTFLLIGSSIVPFMMLVG